LRDPSEFYAVRSGAPLMTFPSSSLEADIFSELRTFVQQLLTSLAETDVSIKGLIGAKEREILSTLETTRLNLLKNFQFESRFAKFDVAKEIHDRFYHLLDKRDRMRFVKDLEEIIEDEKLRVKDVMDFLDAELLLKLPVSRSKETDLAKLGFHRRFRLMFVIDS